MKQLDSKLLDDLTAQAKESPWKRAHYNLHPALEDPLQRLCIAIEPGTYIRPHRHAGPETCEVFLLLRGSATLLFFDDSGRVEERAALSAGGPVFAAEIPAKTWHSIVPLESGTIFFEVKQGPYAQPKGKNVAAWAPEEGVPATARFVDWFRAAKTGDLPPLL
jgi:cupin fold WbuC family metalloprotein